jgi:hypothetical protein
VPIGKYPGSDHFCVLQSSRKRSEESPNEGAGYFLDFKFFVRAQQVSRLGQIAEDKCRTHIVTISDQPSDNCDGVETSNLKAEIYMYKNNENYVYHTYLQISISDGSSALFF